MKNFKISAIILLVFFFIFSGCNLTTENSNPRLSMFVGVDISGSFKNTRYFDDSLDFLSYY